MTTFGVYEVVGRREYRGHKPGEVFEAVLDPGPEQRAIARGDIRLVARVTPTIEAKNITFADGWFPPPESRAAPTQTEAPQGASRVSGGG